VNKLDRYVLKEHVGPLVFALSALTALMLLNYIAKQFGVLVGKGLEWTVIAEFFLLAIPFTIAMTLPMAVLVATIYAMSRLAAENEVTAMKASGVDLHVVLRPVLAAGAGLALLMVLFNDQALPRANHRLRQLQTDIMRKKPTLKLAEQVINEVRPGQLYLRAARIDKTDNRMREVVIYDLADPVHRRTIYADSGDLALTADGRDLVMTLFAGYMQELSRQTPGEMQRVFYRTNVVRVVGIGNALERTDDDGYKGDREQSICELQRQVASSDRDRLEARVRLETDQRNIVRALTRGRAMVRPDSARWRNAPARPSMGRAWCALAGWVLPPVANAQSQGAPPPIPAGTPDPASRDQAVPPASPNGIVTAGAYAPEVTEIAPNVEVLASQAESHRVRWEVSGQGSAGYQVEIEKKFALSVACLVFVLFGAPIALRFPRGGVGLTIGISLVVFSLYYVGLIAGESLADRGVLSPFMAMWAANLLFTVVGLILWRGLGREQATSRGDGLSDWWQQWRDRRRAHAMARARGSARGDAAQPGLA
jgi:lipopolysaccharide export system permease protein